ncbi:MAG: hypothetical protein ACRD0K_09375 [Egibacteraceae bacterium]
MSGPSERAPDAKEGLSPYAWMSVRDGELVKTVLLSAGRREAGRLRVLEWGAGQSTLSYSRILVEQGIPFHWLTLEYDRGFFDTSLAPKLLNQRWADTVLRRIDDGETVRGPVRDVRADIEAVCWNRTALRPTRHTADRTADLDGYVDYPASTGHGFDVIIVDGRKRRRCLLAALALMRPDTIVLLHDAGRRQYQCALERYPASAFLGDDLWAGTSSAARLDEALADGR